ncbi:hypothetical protein OUZ56_000208 [Daphnia magna]|uniref:RING-type E3 ubiquitin transferase n=1 Tax=Daphnia magna TaxID=35525 RepID=A0ABQ9ZYZ8_9CRUS|nr:hypothetical protein OUZ56_000208 [Daphnia magna]
MGKRQHQKDKMYLTSTEWSTLYGGKKPVNPNSASASFRRLPFDHCALSLQLFENPLCDTEGHVFDLLAIVPYLKKYKTNPVTGKPLESKHLLKLNFHKNAEGVYHCPVLFKQFTDKSHIVAIRTTGNVFSYEAVEQLNLKPKNWKELLTDEPFTRQDIITLQDPSHLEKFNIANFHHVKNDQKIENEELIRAKTDPAARLKYINAETKGVLEQLEKDYIAPEETVVVKKVADSINAAHYSTGAVAAGFTSTVMMPETTHEPAILDENIVRYQRIKKKGYVRLVTNLGPVNLELHCDMVPKTCENFINLCKKGYYNNTKFHRSIKHFMIQGGDPTGTGTGGESCWGGSFEDEFKPNLSHTGRGILSMANSGTNTNKSQFFITYRSCKHLDGKHTIFGRVVGGMETLAAMERIGTDNKDRPVEEILIESAQIFTDPYVEIDEQLVVERAAALEAAEKQLKEAQASIPKAELKAFKQSGVGKYINPKVFNKPGDAAGTESSNSSQPKKAKTSASYSFGNFSSW